MIFKKQSLLDDKFVYVNARIARTLIYKLNISFCNVENQDALLYRRLYVTCWSP